MGHNHVTKVNNAGSAVNDVVRTCQNNPNGTKAAVSFGVLGLAGLAIKTVYNIMTSK